MNAQERSKLFSHELNLFSSTAIRNFAFHCLSRLPEYFFNIPASASGKYHPAYTLGEGGLVRHTKAAIQILEHLSSAGILYYYSCPLLGAPDDAYDACLLALMFHDAFKLGIPQDFSQPSLGEEAHTDHAHPLHASSFLLSSVESFLQNYDANNSDLEVIHEAASAVTSHMGRWVTSSRSSVVLPSPAGGDWVAKIVHLCDYLASRKNIEIKLATEDMNGGES